MDPDIPYLLLTPGPLTTSRTVKQSMLRDYCTWDRDYNDLVTEIRGRLVRLATAPAHGSTARSDYTAVLMQGSGTFAVEAVIGSVIPPEGSLLVVSNGAYGRRMAEIAERLDIECVQLLHSEVKPADPARVEAELQHNPQITHVALVHCETTTGMLNPAAEVGRIARRHGKIFILDAMSSFAGMPFTIDEVGAHFLISSANKCIQGVPGFGIVIADRAELDSTVGWARSLSLDLWDQWHEMETKGGKWRYTSPTHAVRAFATALDELDDEGGVAARHRRYCENQRVLIDGMERLGFRPLLAPEHRSPIISSFLYPDDASFTFEGFYEALKQHGFVIYPGKISQQETFRIGTIGHVFPRDFARLIECVGEVVNAGARIQGSETRGRRSRD